MVGPAWGDRLRAGTGSPLLALRTFVRIGFARSAVRPIPARRCSPAHRHVRASLASPPRPRQRVIDGSTGRHRPGLGRPSARGHRQSLAGLADRRPHRLRAVCRAPDPGTALLASASAHTCLAGIAAAPASR
ncbi:hypothetical protein [Sphingomonas sp. CCH18-B1]|uniref:hypothetical protein n=1 Tax=Sphingomonas sp. CCH18-B1 TaxID=1768744 RepID=UPI00082AF857|nr:hypothetical protein [Sphingomonas sp. CCH18-B1]